MSEERKDVNQEEAETSSESSPEENEQASTVTEDVKKTEADGKDYKTIAENLTKALREERERNRQSQARTEVLQAESLKAPTPSLPEDEVTRRFLQAEANSTIAVKIQTDPSFRDRVELVQDYVRKGYDIDMADKLAKADIMDRILAEAPATEKPVIPKQVQPTAVPEAPRQAVSEGTLDDFQSGKDDLGISDNADLIREMLAKYRPQA